MALPTGRHCTYRANRSTPRTLDDARVASMIAYRLRRGSTVIDMYAAVADALERENITLDPAICRAVDLLVDLAAAYARRSSDPKWRAVEFLERNWRWVQRIGRVLGVRVGDFPFADLVALVRWLVDGGFERFSRDVQRVVPCPDRR